MLSLNTFGTVLVSQAPQPVWLWVLNATVIAGDVATIAVCYRRALAA
jgi:hypothetical protein